MAYMDKSQGFAFAWPDGLEIRIYDGRIYICTKIIGKTWPQAKTSRKIYA